MDDALLMRMLHRVADLIEQLQPLFHADAVLVTVLRDLDPIHQFHDEIGPTCLSGSSVQDSSNIRMVHQSQGLALGLEPSDHVFGIHPQLDDLQGHSTANRLFLLGHVHNAATPFPKPLQQLVRSDALRLRDFRRQRGFPR